MKFQYNDGGREGAGFIGKAGDCAVRAIAIATEKPYKEVYDKINEIGKSERTGKRKKGISNARGGVYRQAMHKYFESIGWKWTPTMFIGSGCKVHVTKSELPMGRLVLSLSKHYSTSINGVINDTYDPSRFGTRCVYGYWSKGK